MFSFYEKGDTQNRNKAAGEPVVLICRECPYNLERTHAICSLKRSKSTIGQEQ